MSEESPYASGGGATPSATSFSIGRVFGLFLLLALPGLPMAAVKYYESIEARRAAEEARQAELDRSLQEVAEQLRRGEGGEAFQRLFGIYPEGADGEMGAERAAEGAAK
jgi:hypothetical protein